MSSPIVIITRGPIHIIALIEDTSPDADHGADDTAADLAEDVRAGDAGHVELAGQFVDRRGVKKTPH